MFKFYKNLFYTIVGFVYFGFIYFNGFDNIKNTNLPFGYDYLDYTINYMSAFIGFITVIGLVGIITFSVNFFIEKIYIKNQFVLYISELVIKFIDISKIILALYVFSYIAILPEKVEYILQNFYSVILIFILLFFTTSLINHFFENDLIEKTKLKALGRTLLPFVNKVIVVFVWVIGVITIFDNLGYDISALIAGAGIGGLAIAFAAQKSISNVFGAVTILLNKPFKIGDYVNVNGVIGTVKDIGLSYLTIIERSGHQVMIPNEAIISTNVENYSVRKNRRVDFSIGLVYGTSLEKMKKGVLIIEEILQEYIDKEVISSSRVNFDMFGDFSLNINVTYFSMLNDSYLDFLKQKEEINLEIKKRFKTSKLDIAFPTQELIIKKEG